MNSIIERMMNRFGRLGREGEGEHKTSGTRSRGQTDTIETAVPVLGLVVLPEPLKVDGGLGLVVLEDALPGVEIEANGDLGLLLFGVILRHDSLLKVWRE